MALLVFTMCVLSLISYYLFMFYQGKKLLSTMKTVLFRVHWQDGSTTWKIANYWEDRHVATLSDAILRNPETLGKVKTVEVVHKNWPRM